jgi:multidrug efflux system outer membrane protein
MRRAALPFCAASLVLLCGCKMGPDYERPAVESPENFRGQVSTTNDSIADQPWWEIYQDPALADLIRAAIENNHDLRVALTRVEQARAIAAQTRSTLFPTIGYGAAISSGRNEALAAPVFNNGDNNTPVRRPDRGVGDRCLGRLRRQRGAPWPCTWPPRKPGGP